MSEATNQPGQGRGRLSVIICTHNPRPDYLRRTLASLAEQTLPKAQWDFLLVDNASTAALSENQNLAWHPHGRHILEPQLGLVFARLCGIQQSAGEWLVFVDDDNVLAPDYLANVIVLIQRHPYLAVMGAGRLEPEFEQPPARELNDLLPLLALRSVAKPQWGNQTEASASLPYGAGLVVHRPVAEAFVRLVDELKITTVFGRRGEQLFSHEDELFSWAAAASGKGFGIFPELRITHLIAARRLHRKYFLRLLYYSSISHWLLKYLITGEAPQPEGWLSRLRLLPHALRRGIFSARTHLARAAGKKAAARWIVEKQILSPARRNA
jgi:glycosyltransferase involved in cell wall biosynthesis